MTAGTAGPVVLLDRVVFGVTPAYCLHGRAACVRCRNWCHLGHETERMVTTGEALPLCMACALELRNSGVLPARPASGRVHDHRRSAGPHVSTDQDGWVEAPCGNPTCSRTVSVPPKGTPHPSGAVWVKVCSPRCAEAVTDPYRPGG